jgi:uncharacterized protein YdaU (DUF1376 family)
VAKAPAFQLYAQDFDMDTATWENDEVGAYLRLLFYEWVNGGIPNDMQAISKIVREPIEGSENKRYRVKFERNLCDFGVKMERNVLKKFHLNGNGLLVNSRLESERQKQSEYRESQREKGVKSAKKRWAGHITSVRTTVTERLQPKDNSSSSTSSSIKNKESISHSDTKTFLSFYKEKFTQCFGTEPQIEWGKDGSITNKLLKTIPLPELESLLERFFVSEDKFIRGSGYTIGVFKTQINKLKIGSGHQDGIDLWLKVKEEQDARNRQKEVLSLNEKVESDISNES